MLYRSFWLCGLVMLIGLSLIALWDVSFQTCGEQIPILLSRALTIDTCVLFDSCGELALSEFNIDHRRILWLFQRVFGVHVSNRCAQCPHTCIGLLYYVRVLSDDSEPRLDCTMVEYGFRGYRVLDMAVLFSVCLQTRRIRRDGSTARLGSLCKMLLLVHYRVLVFLVYVQSCILAYSHRPCLARPSVDRICERGKE